MPLLMFTDLETLFGYDFLLELFNQSNDIYFFMQIDHPTTRI